MDFIWTNHALKRLKERKIDQDFAHQTLRNPDEIFEDDGATKMRKKFLNQTATAVIKKNDIGENIVVSFWVDPPNVGTKDYKNNLRRNEMIKASFIKKLALTFLNQIGLR